MFGWIHKILPNVKTPEKFLELDMRRLSFFVWQGLKKEPYAIFLIQETSGAPKEQLSIKI